MPDYKPNQFVRAFAVLALIAAFVLVVAVVATSGGGSGGGDNGSAQVKSKSSGPTKRGRVALDRGFWIVHPQDTLGKISAATGIDIDTLVQLNPDLDPQTLLEGQRIALR